MSNWREQNWIRLSETPFKAFRTVLIDIFNFSNLVLQGMDLQPPPIL